MAAVLLCLAALLLSVLHSSHGECLYSGMFYMNNTVWQPDSCTVCTCHDLVAVCQAVRCSNPGCSYNQGEHLLLPQGACCPVCASQKQPCQFRGQSVPHNTEWMPSTCTTCYCDDGEVRCGNVTCPPARCGPGQLEQSLPGQCCPKCLPAGRSCVDKDGERHVDGSEWEPLACTKCVCRDGQSACFPMQCPALLCPEGQKAERAPGSCCPTCTGTTCYDHNQRYKDGAQWQRDACTHCVCLGGFVECHTQTCVPSPVCPQGQVLQTRPGECCPECVTVAAACMVGGRLRYHGDLWNVSSCEFCFCRNGHRECRHAACAHVQCRQGETLEQKPGDCCPSCSRPLLCDFADTQYQAGDTWHPDPCTVCNCRRQGEVVCYQKTCPVCPDGMAPVLQPGQCCGSCQTVNCADSCSACLPSDPRHCTQCALPGKLVQDGDCVDMCRDGYFPSRDNTCEPCHESCATCQDASEFHCSACPPGSLWRDGQCVASCGARHYVKSGRCYECHASCRTCFGPEEGQCLSCAHRGQLLLKGGCVDDCGPHFYQRDQECHMCPPSCKSCLPDRAACASCPDRAVLHSGQCLSACPRGFHPNQFRTCSPCHPSCASCWGGSAYECEACHQRDVLRRGQCVSLCPGAQFMTSQGSCQACGRGCRFCYPSSEGVDSVCGECLDSSKVPYSSSCSPRCPAGFYLHHGVCRECDADCMVCEAPGQCTKCFPPHVLASGHCVRTCPLHSHGDSTGVCRPCAEHCLQCQDGGRCEACDSATYLQKGSCVSQCDQNFLPDDNKRVCEANQEAPILQVAGPVQVRSGGVEALPAGNFLILDTDTPADKLRVYVRKAPRHGHLVRTANGEDQVLDQEDFFTVRDIETGKVRFVHDRNGKWKDTAEIQVSDGHLYSDQARLTLQALPPQPLSVARNQELQAAGGEATVLSPATLDLQSAVSEDQVNISVLEGPRHGRLVLRGSDIVVTSFTLKDLRAEAIAYQHWANQSQPSDQALLQASDGFFQLSLLLEVAIRPKGSKLPILINNRGGQVERLGLMVITKDMLQATVPDPSALTSTDVIYTLVPSVNNPKEGEILMVVPVPASGAGRGWEELGGGRMGAKMFRFLQRDIDEGRIWYRHLGGLAPSDVFTFEVADAATPPNVLRGQSFHVAVAGERTEALAEPTLAPGVRLGMTVLENQVVPVTAASLAYEDLDTEAGRLVYTLTTLLGEGEGTLEHVAFPFQPLLKFTQDDLDHQRVLYRPPQQEIGAREKEVSFSFVVSDGGRGRRQPEQKFTIRILPVNNAAPRFHVARPSLTVAQGAATFLEPDLFQVSDPDTDSDQLRLTLTRAPVAGRLEHLENGAKVTVRTGDAFAYASLDGGQFQYVHGGSATELEDVLEVTATDGVHETVQRVAVSVLAVDKLAPFMLPAASCHLNLTEGETAVLTREDLSFGDGEDADHDINIVLATAPLQGQLLLTDRRLALGQSFTQEDINLGHVSYKAADEVGSKPVTELLYFNVSDSSANTLPNQVLSVLTLPRDNQPPLVAVGWDLEVDEGGEVILDPELISVTDVDSPLAALSLVVDSPPSFGFLRNTRPEPGSERDGQAAVTRVWLQDLLDGHVRYVQADHRHKEPAWDGLLFHVSDGSNVSPTLRLNVSINLVNDEAPLMVTEQLFVQEGRVVALTNASMYVVDIDTDPEDLIFTLDLPPVFGSLKRKDFIQDPPLTARILGAGDKFTYEDILQELIIYHHNDDEVTTDTFRLHLSDGDFNDSKSLNVIVGLINDETPRMTVNRGLRVQAGSTTAIKAKDLRASDVDSDDEKIVYTLTSDPSAGKLQFHKGDLVYLLTAKSQANTFTQQHVDRGYIEYVHSPGEMTGNIIFKFKLSDPEGNDLIDQSFYITILEDRIPPEELANREFTVTEGERRKLTTDFLSFTDADSEPGLLRYVVVEGPSLGHLELTARPGVPVLEFSQAELAAGSVLYVHDSVEEEYLDTFSFIVSDGTNQVVKTFFIKISPVDDSIPLLTNRGLRVQEGVRKLITEFELKAVDKDTREDQIVFTVVQAPAHGALELQRGEEFRPAVSFSMRDVYENHVSYLHDGSETLEDNFSFTLTDGTNSLFAMQRDAAPSLLPITAPQEFQIEILPMDDGSPVLTKNLGLQFLESSGFEVSNLITERELLAEDEDTRPEDLQFVVTQAPRLGRLERVGNPGRPIQAFTQEDVTSGFVRYVLTQRTDETQDSFTFDLVDGKPNLVPDNVFHVMWSRVAFEQTQYNVSETAGVVRIPVVRMGNLKQYSIVTCRSVEGTATSRPQAQQPGTHDFLQEAKQVQFDDWQDMKTCAIIINDDSTFEGRETFYVELVAPTYTLLGGSHKVTVTVLDTEDEPLIQFARSVYYVNETDSYVMATVTRTGDLSKTVSAICSTQSMTATGSSLTRLESGSDYISRGETNANRVVFPPGVTTAACDVKILDDSEFESAEQFELVLSEPSLPGALGPQSSATVIIEGPNDESAVFLSQSEYHFDENHGTVEVEVLREGSDLSHTTLVWCATRLSSPPSATPGQDYVPSSAQLTFGPGQGAEKCQLNILDDEFDPRLEGNETFVVFLSSAVGSSLAEPYFASVVIHDSLLDVPQMTFVQDQYYVDEKNGTVNVTVLRSGDLSFPSSVLCYSRQGSATVMADFQERALTQDSRVSFLPGERAKNCSVQIADDEEFEPEEQFTLRLAEPQGTELCPARLGVLTSVTVTITNHDDVPTLQLERAAYSINEPSAQDQVATVTVVVVRSGDVNQTSSVRCSTRDGSAQSGIDYNPKSLVLTFDPGERRVEFPVDILYNDDVEWHESFSVQLGPADPVGAMMGPVSIATITILDNEVSGSLILPAAPVVVSLMHYDDAEQGVKVDPSPGYPLVCITPCNVQYPTYAKTHGLCQESAINQSSILYRWEVAMPEDKDGSRPPFVQVSDRTLYTSVDKMVLDAIYFRPRFRVRCVAQPLHENGNPGVPLRSRPVTIGSSNALCSSPAFGPDPYGYQAQSFLAALDYRGPEDTAHPNTIHIAVKVPHQDGMLPLLSTHPLHNLRFLLSEPVYRQQHVCSSLLGPQERAPLVKDGFLNSYDSLEPPYGPGYDFPYQFDETLREPRTLSLYQHLNLKSCVWTFQAWYHMTELIDICGGQIVSDFEVKDAAKTHLTVRVPLYVSYLYASAPVGWGSLEHHTQIEFSFYYDAILWGRGLETEGHSGGKVQVMRILIGDDGRLVIEFRSQAKFRGLFVLGHHTLPDFSSRLLPPASLAISFHLQLLWSQQTFDSPYQLWRATSKFNLKDYTGKYVIELIPCKVKPTQAYLNSDPLPCSAEAPQRFEVPIAFQQTNRPVPLVYSLDTEFQLTNNRKMFLLDPAAPNMDDDLDFTGSFAKGEKIYGRVLWSPKQDLKTAYRLTIEKVYLCTGMDGYIPTYDPTGDIYKEGPQYGCLQPSPNLRHRFLIIDRQSPDVAQRDFQEIAFQAELARDNADFLALTQLPGVDGFVLSADPLYKVDPGHQWYLQVVYMIGPADKPHFRLRRASGLTSGLQARQRRAVVGDEDWLQRRESRNGTNMQQLHLAGAPDGSGAQQGSLLPIVLPVVLALVVVIIVVVIIVVVRRRRRRGARKHVVKDTKEKPPINIQNNLVLLHQEERMGKSQKSLHRLSVRLSESSGDLKKIGISTGSMKRTQVKEINLKNDYGKNLDGGTEV